MEFKLKHAMEILRATPGALDKMLRGLSPEWLYANEGGDTWSPHTVVGHLVFSEEVNWMPRVRKIVAGGDNRFELFNRLGQFELYRHHDIGALLDKFARVRDHSLAELVSLHLSDEMLSRQGIHPDFGEVTLSQLLSTWTAHDLDHINQISRVLAKQYAEAVGPWISFLGVLTRR